MCWLKNALFSFVRQIVFFNKSGIHGLALENGEKLWYYEWKGSINIPTPLLIAPDKLFISSSYEKGAALLKLDTKEEFEEGLKLYHSRKFAEASVHFNRIKELNPDDMAAQLYLKRSAQFMVQGVPEDWEGVETMLEK